MIDSKTRVLGLFGYPLGHSISPLLHNQALKDLGLNYVYLPFPIEPGYLEDGVRAIRALNIRGVNVTIPYKEEVIPFLDEVDSLARKIGAVNTIVNNNGKLKGYNTDFTGFQRMLEEDGRFRIEGKKAVIIGAGGASRAVGIALCQRGIEEIHLLNRTRERAEELALSWQKYYPEIKIKTGGLEYDYCKPLISRADLLVDTTPVGMAPNMEVEPVIPAEVLHSNLLVVDLVYNPAETTLLKAAKRAGAETLNGLGMLLYQGIEAFKLWTDIEPEIDSWRTLVEKEFY